jgi:hypothetical protein
MGLDLREKAFYLWDVRSGLVFSQWTLPNRMGRHLQIIDGNRVKGWSFGSIWGLIQGVVLCSAAPPSLILRK